MDEFVLSVVILCPCITFINVMQISRLPLMLFLFSQNGIPSCCLSQEISNVASS